MALTSVSQYCALNLGGLSTLDYLPVAWVDTDAWERLISSGWEWTDYPLTLTEGGWLSMSLLPQDRSWEERERRSPQGKYYEQLVQGTIRSMRPSVSGLLDEMAEYAFLLRLKDRNGRTWLIGTPDYPLRFTSSGGARDEGGLNAYNIEFSGETPHKAYGLSV